MKADDTCGFTLGGGSAGVCILKGTILSVASTIHGAAALGVYEVASDGTIEGVFMGNYHGGGPGREKVTPIR